MGSGKVQKDEHCVESRMKRGVENADFLLVHNKERGYNIKIQF